MKRLAYVLVMVLLAGGAWRAAESYRIKHPVSGREITVPGQQGPAAMLPGGWKESSADNFVNGYRLFGAAKNETAVSWLGISTDGALLYALNNSDGHLYILETRGGRGVGRVKVGDHPLSARLSKDGRTLYVANLGSASVSVVDVSDPAHPTAPSTLATDPHPNDVVVTADHRLFVYCGHTHN